MALSSAFPPQEYGSGTRASLTPADRAFLESDPTYDDGASLPPSIAAPPMPTPSLARRILSKLLFVAIVSGACYVLGLAILRMLNGNAAP